MQAAVCRFNRMEVDYALAPWGPSSSIVLRWLVRFGVPAQTEPLRPHTRRVPSLKMGEESLGGPDWPQDTTLSTSDSSTHQTGKLGDPQGPNCGDDRLLLVHFVDLHAPDTVD